MWINRAEVEDNCSEKIKGCGKRMKKLWKIKKWSSAVFQSIGKKGRTDQKPAKKKTIRNVHNKKASGTNMNKSAKNRADHSNPQRSVRKKK